jgi:hypothetical protein
MEPSYFEMEIASKFKKGAVKMRAIGQIVQISILKQW